MEALVNYSSEDEHDDDEGYEIRVNSPYEEIYRKKNHNAECQRIFFLCIHFAKACVPPCVYKYVCVRCVCVAVHICTYICMQIYVYK